MMEQQAIELASKIDRFEDSGNFKRIYFNNPEDVEGLKKSIMELGIKDIVNAKTIAATASHIDTYMFEVKYMYSGQQRIVEDLERKHKRIKAWTALRSFGGMKMTEAEKAYFDKKDAEFAAAKLKNRQM